MFTVDSKSVRKAKSRDRIARSVIILGGVTIIASVVAILLLIVGVTLPLFRPAQSQSLVDTRLPQSLPADRVVGLGVDLNLGEDAIRSLTADVLSTDGMLTFLDLGAAVENRAAPSKSETGGKPDKAGIRILGQEQISGTGSKQARTVRTVERHAGSRLSVLWSDGSLSLVEVSADAEFDEKARRSVAYRVKRLAEAPPEKGGTPLRALMRFFEDRERGSKGLTCVRQLPGERICVVRELTVENDMLGEEETTTNRLMIDKDIPGPIGAMTMDRSGSTLYVGTRNGCLAWWEFDAEGNIVSHDVIPAFRDKRGITALALVLGEVSLAVGDEKGGLSTWLRIRTADATQQNRGSAKLRLVHQLPENAGPIHTILPSQRNKSLVSLGADGQANLDYVTSERRLLALQAGSPLQTIGYARDGNALIGVDAKGQLVVWRIDSPHPEIGWQTLFGQVFYEGYSEPEHAWQTTGGEEFEPKFGLVPLLFGTLKGTFYAMLFAVPLALLAAAYTSHFTTPRFKGTIKPVVEIMAAVPSVVIGFLIALWLAPIVERGILAVFASLVTIPLCFVSWMAVWQLLRRYDWAKRIENGYEFLVLIPVIIAGVVCAVWLVGPLETLLFGGNFKLWLFETLQMRYDQRNCIIIAFGLGFAVIPIIFSIAEDSLSNVPHTLTAASMAMGASRWQTLWRIVLPSASPGIFAATMIGFGRAVGETMIVLMATGNTPILDGSPFNGMRTLSANIAVEIPEAPVGGTLYRVLFLCAVLLFLLTFALNTAAEVVRHRLRKQYGQF